MKTKRQIEDKPFLGFPERSVMILKAAEVECIAFFYDSPPPCRLKEEFQSFLGSLLAANLNHMASMIESKDKNRWTEGTPLRTKRTMN